MFESVSIMKFVLIWFFRFLDTVQRRTKSFRMN
jgi:hypothetical protein